MDEKNSSSDARRWMYERYIGDDPEAQAHLKRLKVQADIAEQIYYIRKRLHMTREQLAESSGLPVETVEDLEESDFEGDWDEAVEKINRGFRNWFNNVIVPASRMEPEEFSVKVASA